MSNGTESPVLPSEVGESNEVNGHLVKLHDPDGAIARKFNCERCGMWVVSGIHFERMECSAGSNTGTGRSGGGASE